MAVKCGHVYFLLLPIAAKEKLCVPAYVDEATGRVRFFVINTERTDYQLERPEVLRHIFAIAEKDHKAFLTHDSWLMCHEVIGGWMADDIDAKKNCYRGPLDAAIASAVRAAIGESRLYSERERATILRQWKD